MNTDQVMDRYNDLKKYVISREEQFDKFIYFIENETEWLTAPASTKYHLCEEGGLLEHSVNVCETMIKLKNSIAPDLSNESCVITALFHDIGKVGMPGRPQYIKNVLDKSAITNEQKNNYIYKFNKDLTYLSVPVRSIYLITKYIYLTEEEVQAIIYHDGQYVEDNRSCATREKPLTLLLQYADSWSGFVIEKDK